MAEYIDREAFLEHMKRTSRYFAVKFDVEEFPAADVAPVRHGRWIKESDGGTKCSVCNKRVRDVTDGVDEPVDLSEMPYCPKCGARMDGDDHG